MSNVAVGTNLQPVVGTSKTSAYISWAFLGLFLVNSALFSLTNNPIFPVISPSINILCLTMFALFHGSSRYGIKNMMVLLVISYALATIMEFLSIHYGFPFSFYKYVNVPGPRIYDVPYVVGIAYFGMGYVCWMLASLLVVRLGHYKAKLEGSRKFTIPVIATFIMVMWDLCFDPIYATIYSMWVWQNPGSYFGIPLANYAGWFLTVYLIFQCFSLYIANHDDKDNLMNGNHKPFWAGLITAYFCQGVIFILFNFSRTSHLEIYQSMGLVFVLTMFFVVILSFLAVRNLAESSS